MPPVSFPPHGVRGFLGNRVPGTPFFSIETLCVLGLSVSRWYEHRRSHPSLVLFCFFLCLEACRRFSLVLESRTL